MEQPGAVYHLRQQLKKYLHWRLVRSQYAPLKTKKQGSASRQPSAGAKPRVTAKTKMKLKYKRPAVRAEAMREKPAQTSGSAAKHTNIEKKLSEKKAPPAPVAINTARKREPGGNSDSRILSPPGRRAAGGPANKALLKAAVDKAIRGLRQEDSA